MSDRRRFLIGAGASILAASALPEPTEAKAGGEVVSDNVYAVGLVSNRPSGQLLLNVYLAVENGTGFGAISDPVHPLINSHVEIHETRRHGNQFEFDGMVIRSNDQGRLGLRVQIDATVHGDATSLAVEFGGETFSGLGFVTEKASGQ